MIYIKTDREIELINDTGKISKEIMDMAIKKAEIGVDLMEIEDFIQNKITEFGAESWFKEKNKYPFSSCLSVNEVWVHGMPHKYKLKDGDVLSIDIGIKYKGFYTDHCLTVGIGSINSEKKAFLDKGEEALSNAIANFKVNNRVGDISYGMQSVIENAGYSVIKEFIGHGVGLKAHEDPIIPCYGKPNSGAILRPGMVFAIEIMYAMGKSDIKLLDDGWSIKTADNSLTGMFEHTVALTEKGSVILTI